MKILQLQLHNFGVYAGDNVFRFHGKKPIVLIGGMNGRGKTTFLEAVLLALYGANSVAFRESKKRSYTQYLRSFVHKHAQDQQSSIVLDFVVHNGELYQISRSWDTLGKKTQEIVNVKKNGVHNDFLTKNWPMFIENILPSALSNFFFFDGEKIAEMALDGTNAQLKKAIRSMLGITVLDVLHNDILRNLQVIGRKGSDHESQDKLEKLRVAKEDAATELKHIDDQVYEAQEKLAKDTALLTTMRQRYNAKGGDALAQRQKVVQEIAATKSNIQMEEAALYELSAHELPLVMVGDLLREIKLQATDEHTDQIMRQALVYLDELLLDYQKEKLVDAQTGVDFVAYIKRRTQENHGEIIYGLSDQALFQVNNLIEGKLEQVKHEADNILQKEQQQQKRLEEWESHLMLDTNDKELQQFKKEMRDMESMVMQDRTHLNELARIRTDAHAQAVSKEADFNKYVEAYLATAEMHDQADRITKYSHMALKILAQYQVELQKRKTDALAATATKCYQKLAHKKSLIKQVVMDPASLDITYLAPDGHVIAQEALSAGEQQLMVISVLWALAICSKKKLPVIIDTPLSRLDSVHRKALITTYFPQAGEQTIILSTDSEIDHSFYELMKSDIGDEFTLQYNEATQSTSIREGYLIGV